MPWDLTLVVEILREFGIPVAVLVVFAGAMLLKRKRKRDGLEIDGAALLVPGWQLDAAHDDCERARREAATELEAVRKARNEREFQIRSEATDQVAYVEARRVEERAARLAADERLTAALELVRVQGETLDELRIDVARLTGIRPSAGGRDA